MAHRRSFAFGAGFYAWPYYGGVAAYVQQRGLLGETARVYGTSSGVTVATYLVCGVDIEREGLPAGLQCNERHRRRLSGAFFHPAIIRNSMMELMDRVLPNDAHIRATNRLFIVLCELPQFRRRIVSEFPTRESLFEAVLAAIAIPGFSVWLPTRWPRLNVGWCVDGVVVENVAEDDRQGWSTVRVGLARVRSLIWPRRRALDISPSSPVRWRSWLTVENPTERVRLFELGKRDAAVYFAESV